MRVLRFLGVLLLVFLVHLVAVSFLPTFPRFMDLFLVLVVLSALDGNSLAGLLAGLVAGLAQDVVSTSGGGSLYGLHGFVLTLVGYGAALAAQYVFLHRVALVGLFVGLAATLHQVLILILRLFLLGDPEVPSPRWLVVKSIACGVAGALLFGLSGQLKRRRELWSLRRGSKLQLGKGLRG